MAETAASTAYGPMVIVAIEQAEPQAQRIITDKIAYQFLPLYMRLIVKLCQVQFIRRAFANLLEQATPGIYTTMLCRKRYIEDKVLESLNAKIEAVVILGAGLDTLAYRFPQLATVQVYEVDLPENIHYKKAKLESIYGQVPAHVSLVSIDFEKEKLGTALQKAGYSLEKKTCFIWEGVTQYLNESAVRDTLSFLETAKLGSRLLFTHIQEDFITGKNTYNSDAMYQRFRGKNPLWLFGLDPQKVPAFIKDYGWQVIEQLKAEDYAERYLKPKSRNGLISELEPIVFAEKINLS